MANKKTQKDTKTQGLGNTLLAPNVEKKETRCWFFTWNNYTKTNLKEILTWFNKIECEYMFQEEKGEEGTPHLQGVVSFKSAKQFNTLHAFNNKIHWEICKNKKAAIAYCCKVDSRNGEIFNKGFKIIEPEEPLFDLLKEEKNRYRWQQKVIDTITQKPDNRKIEWWYEPKGAAGKTTLVKHLCIKHDAILVGCRNSDMKYAIATTIENKKPIKIIIVDIPFDCEFNEYEGLEEIKNGLFFSGKYKSGMCIFNIPHLLVFANTPPNTHKMGANRFNVHKITPMDKLKVLTESDSESDNEYEYDDLKVSFN